MYVELKHMKRCCKDEFSAFICVQYMYLYKTCMCVGEENLDIYYMCLKASTLH